MDLDGLTQQLISDGIHRQDFFLHFNWFRNCTQCTEAFTFPIRIPHLLKCGHLICKSCFTKKTPCPCCHHIKKLKISNYETIFALDHFDKKCLMEDKKLYDFRIFLTSSSNSVQLMEISTVHTIEKLLSSSEDFVSYEKKMKGRVGIIIGSKLFVYEDIKESKVENFQYLLSKNINKVVNQITILNRNL